MTCKTSNMFSSASLTTVAWLISVAVVPLTLVATGPALAVSSSVKNACKSDYLAYCSNHAVGSKSLRGCMRAASSKLSNRCVKALAAAGEVSKADRARYAKRFR